MTEIDWDSLQKDADNTLLADGEYNLIVVKGEATRSSTNKPMIKLRLAVVDGPRKDFPLFTQLTLSADNPMALRMWFNNLAAFGLGQDYFATKPTLEQLAETLVGRGVRATVGRRNFNNVPRNDIQKYAPYQPHGPVPAGLVTGPSRGPSGTIPLSTSTTGPAQVKATSPLPQPVPITVEATPVAATPAALPDEPF